MEFVRLIITTVKTCYTADSITINNLSNLLNFGTILRKFNTSGSITEIFCRAFYKILITIFGVFDITNDNASDSHIAAVF